MRSARAIVKSEMKLSANLENAMRETKGKFIVTTYSSNIARLNQTIDAARKTGRLVCFLGRSLLKTKEVGTKIGYLKLEKDLEIDIKQLKNVKDSNVVLIVAGASRTRRIGAFQNC